MTAEIAVLVALVAVWVLTPVLIFVWMRVDAVQDGLENVFKLPGKIVRKIVRKIASQAKTHVVEPIQITYGSRCFIDFVARQIALRSGLKL